ncbi:LPS-assembly protein LptD [Terrihabitans soli]|uniref:LPS-assembly protein LptD n=1 Tax=Terrihabitans soli TaxID=708113 RepID=A0A6S6QKI3_9HYPH|nr:LPS-assembly protein LptD [Terrihabitans soli]BCJ90854.1 LPS-assembly protein LptD [Terrihabitans soli]
MFVTADEVVYDDVRNTASAVGRVKLYYGQSTLEADRVVYDQNTGQVFAYGNVRLNDDGNVYQSEHMVLTDDFRDGFVQSLLVEGADKTRFAAAKATRTGGNVVVFEKGVYTACEPCRENPNKPPLWQVKAARIIHDQGTKMVHYEDARLEFFGKPIAWLPFFSHADSTVKRKSGFLMPSYMASTEYGFGVKAPYFWAVKPNMDVTLAPAFLTDQGIMGDVEFRHRVMNGAYSIRAAGLHQSSPDLFPTSDQQEDFRGAITTRGDFRINNNWTWGWNAHLLSDKYFLDDYDMWGKNWSEAISTVHLTGIGERNYFEARAYHYYGLSADDDQDELPVAGVFDYNYVHDKPVLGGEVAFNLNMTNTWRRDTDFEPATPGNSNPDVIEGVNLSCDTFSSDCLVPGVGGVYSRFSADTSWRRQFIDPVGQVWTPFAYARGDVIYTNAEENPNLAGLMSTDDEYLARGMVGAGLEYRYPFVAESSIGTHILEPIAQIIIRPDEQEIGNIPNEDAQSLFFDTSTLFAWDKFSGYDRIEGGSRANVGLQYTLNFANGGFTQLMFGQSYHLFGKNSFAEADLAGTGINSGLETDRSDYVASAYLKFHPNWSMSTRTRFDEDANNLNALEIETSFKQGPVSASIIYGNYDEQPQLGFERAEGVVGSARVSLTDNYYVVGAAGYNLQFDRFDQVTVGGGYMDECFTFGGYYSVDFNKDGNEDPVHKVMVSVSLRTLGQYQTSFDVSRFQDDAPATP